MFAGGCFWSMEYVFDELPGVVSVTVGYAYRTHAVQYKIYRIGCGRDARLKQLWGPPH
jgi:peptide methionine sulfoxide reductase MsrA